MDRSKLPLVGLIVHNAMRESAVMRLMTDCRVVAIATPDSCLHRITDYSIPVPTLDCRARLLWQAICDNPIGKSIDHFVSWRDGNVQHAASFNEILARRNGTTAWHRQVTGRHIAPKSAFRSWLNNKCKTKLNGWALPVPFLPLRKGLKRQQFKDLAVRFIREHGPAILKPDRGSCKHFVAGISNDTEVVRSFDAYDSASDFRGGDFILEKRITGSMFSIETVVTESVQRSFVTEYLPHDDRTDCFWEPGHMVPPNKPIKWRSRLERLASVIHENLGVKHIVTHMEVIVPNTDDEEPIPAIIELNPRLAGGLIPELHFSATGADLARLSFQVARRSGIDRSLLGAEKPRHYALINFRSSLVGRLTLNSVPKGLLRHSDDRFASLHPSGSILTGGDTNDDDAAYTIVVGNDPDELRHRSKMILDSAVTIPRAGIAVHSL